VKLMRKHYYDDTPGKRYYVYGNPRDAVAVLLEVDMLKVYPASRHADAEITKIIYQSIDDESFGEYQEGNLIVMEFYRFPDNPQDAKKELIRLSLDDVGQ